MDALLRADGTLLHELREHVLVVVEPVASALSSTAVRAQVAQVCLTCALPLDSNKKQLKAHVVQRRSAEEGIRPC